MTPEEKAKRTLELVQRLLILYHEYEICHVEEAWVCGDPDCCGDPLRSAEYTDEAKAIFTELAALYPKE